MRLPSGWSGPGLAAAAFLTLAVLFGGAVFNNDLRLAAIELAALPLLGVSALKLWDTGAWKTHRLALGIALACLAIPLLQLMPLPVDLWRSLPGHEQAALALDVAGLSPGWLPYSLTPDATMRALLALLAPLAMFMTVLVLPRDDARRLPQVLLALTALSLVLGAVQLATASDAVYPWATTNRGDLAGFFANRNHLVTLCLVAICFSATMIGRAAARGVEGRTALWSWVLFVGVLVVAVVAARSRMGVALILPTLLVAGVVVRMAAGKIAGWRRLAIGLGAALVVAGAVSWTGSAAVIARFENQETDRRIEGWPLAFEAAQTYLPAGAGMGAFDPVFRSVEPQNSVDETYFNFAHNEYLEAWLEAGWPAIGVLIAFLVWLGRRIAELWRRPGQRERAAPAAAAAILAILAHSVVDFPLRNVTMAVILATCCALLERRGRDDRPASGRRGGTG